MDWFEVCLVVLTLVELCILHIFFLARITGKRWRAWHFVCYFCLLCLIQNIAVTLDFPNILSIAAEGLALYGVSRMLFGNERSVSCISSILAVYITQLSFGIMNSIESIMFVPLVRGSLLYLAIILATAAAFFLCACCYAFVLRFLSLKEDDFRPYIWILLLSGLFFCSAEFYILQTAYTYTTDKMEPGKHLLLLSLQVLGLCAFLCTLYAYGRVCSDLQAQAELLSLSQAARAQKNYVAEARLRYEKTRSFCHDVKNHLSVLDALLHTDRIEEAKDYLKKLEITTATLSFPYQTGNPIVDVLLGEKMELAELKGILTEVSLILPKPCGIDDFDLCVIFANALDNAIEACQSAEDAMGSISVRGERQGDFYMLEFVNNCGPGTVVKPGTGLSNIKAVAEKYHGAMLIEKSGGWFRLNVLLNIHTF